MRLVTVPGAEEREFALEVRAPTGTTLVLNDVVAHIPNTSSFGEWLLRLMDFAGDKSHVPLPIRSVLIKDKDWCIGNLCMGLTFGVAVTPPALHVANNGPPTLVDVLDLHGLLSTALSATAGRSASS